MFTVATYLIIVVLAVADITGAIEFTTFEWAVITMLSFIVYITDRQDRS